MDGARWQQIETLFFAALDRELNERTKFLRQVCGADEDLYLQVDSLLSAHETSEDFLDDACFSIGLKVLDKSLNVLEPNQKFGGYKVSRLLGSGGMGEVYLARDERLGRNVAIKLLPEFLTKHAGWRERFAREALAAAAVSHPNIAHVYEVGENDNLPYIAMEYVAGKSLRAHLRENRALSEAEAVKIVTQIASALAAAHSAGIVHRDIKPENVILREDGYVKVLDFGIAKFGESASGEEANLTAGTPRYMPPEQLRGEAADARADVWSLGVVLYELLTNKIPFQNDDNRSIAAQILDEKPVELGSEKTKISAPVQKILRRALAKNAENRYESAAEMLRDLQSISVSEKPNYAERWLLVITALLITTAIGAALFDFNQNRNKLSRLSAPPLISAKINETGRTVCAAISPDAARAASAVDGNGRQSIYLKNLNSGEAPAQIVALSETNDFEGACLAFSPDGGQIYYGVYENESLDGKLYRVPATGGDPEFLLREIDSPVSFSPDGARMVYLVVKENEEKLVIADADGANRKDIIVRHRPQFLSHDGHPSWSPDGKFIAFAGGASAGKRQMFVYLYDVETGAEKTLTTEPFYDVNQIGWMPDGNSLVVITRQDGENRRRLYRVAFPGGEAARLTEDFYDYAIVSVARAANKFVTVAAEDEAQIWKFDTQNNQILQITSGKNDSQGVAWLDNERIVFGSQTNDSWDLWTTGGGGDLRQLTNDKAFDTDPAASPDGKFVVFSSNRAGIYNLWRMNLESGELIRLTNGTGEYYPQISPDGEWAVFHRTSPGDAIAVWKISTSGGSPAQLNAKATTRADISPDGKQVASTFREAGESNFSIAVYDFEDGKNLKLLKPLSGARLFIPLRWSPDGKSVVYVVGKDGVDNLWSHPVDGKTAPRQITNLTADRIYGFDFSPDGLKIAAARGRRKSSAVMFEVVE
jgi:eukaryotic-like serine/threonine-protein kinase